MDETIKLKEKVSYGLGDLGSNLIYTTTVLWLMFFYTNVFGLPPAIAGTLLLLARVWDAVNDPLMGLIVDKTSTKWGKTRPYIIAFAVPVSIVLVLTFYTPDFSYNGKIIYAFITYIFLVTFYTAVNLPYGAMLPLITQDVQERTSFSMFRKLGSSFGMIIVAFVPILVSLLGSGNTELEINRTGYFRVMMIFGIIMIILYFITFINTKERVKSKNKDKLTIKEAFECIKVNRPCLIITLFTFIIFTIDAIIAASLQYYIKYYLGKPENFSTVVMIVFILGQMTGILLTPKLSFKFGRKKTVIYASILSLVTYIGIYAFFPMIVLILISAFFNAIGKGISATLIYSFTSDTVEYGQWKTGKRAEGFIYSAQSFATKAATGVAAFILGIVLTLCKYDSQLLVQNNTVKLGIIIVFIAIPFVLNIVQLLVILKYDLTKEKYEQIIEELKLTSLN